MSRMTFEELLLANLKEELDPTHPEYMSKDEMIVNLKNWTGQDFGSDVQQWEQWITKYGLPIINVQPEYLVTAIAEYKIYKKVKQNCVHCGGKLQVTPIANGYRVECENNKCQSKEIYVYNKVNNSR